MSDARQYDDDLIQSQGHEPLNVENPVIVKSLRHLQWELAKDHRFLNYGTISKFDQAGFLIFCLVFVSHDFEVGTYVSYEESTVSWWTYFPKDRHKNPNWGITNQRWLCSRWSTKPEIEFGF